MRQICLAVALFASTAVPATADVLTLPETAGATAFMKPSKGTTMRDVTREYGQPAKKHRPVGGSSRQQPPITRWDYPGFSVFFEYDHVVDTVVPGAPPALQRTGELQPG